MSEMTEFPMCLKIERLTSNNLTAKFLWMLNTCFSTMSDFGVQKYIYIFDVVDLHSMKARQFFACLVPSSSGGAVEYGNGPIWGMARLIFIPTNETKERRSSEEEYCFFNY